MAYKRFWIHLLALVLVGCTAIANYNPYADLSSTETPRPAPSSTTTAQTLPIGNTPAPTDKNAVTCVVTASNALNLRAGPGTNYAVIHWLKAGERLTRTDSPVQNGVWWEVVTPDGLTGWVNSLYCD